MTTEEKLKKLEKTKKYLAKAKKEAVKLMKSSENHSEEEDYISIFENIGAAIIKTIQSKKIIILKNE